MRRFATYFILAAAVWLSSPFATAGVWPFSSRKAPKAEVGQKADTAKKPTPYQKFVKKKSLKKADGFVTLYTDGKEIWLEVPDSLIGRKILLTTTLRQSSDPWIEVGQRVNANRTLLIGCTDSLLTLTEPVRFPESADSLERAILRNAATEAIRYAFPIAMRNNDSTTVVVKAGKLFDPSNKDVVDMKAVLFGENTGFMDGSLKSELSGKNVPVSVGCDHIGLSRELTFEGAKGNYSRGNLSMDAYGRKIRVTGEFVTLLSLVPDREIPVRKVDSRVGVRSQAYNDYSSSKGVRAEQDAVRWNIAPGDHITFYIDTLFSVKQRAAIRRGLQAWNAGFRQAGLGDVIRAVSFPRDSAFNADNPFICKVVSTRCDIDLARYTTCGSPLTGGLLGATITVPQGYLTQIWRKYAFSISEADPRFRTLFPSEDALCEILQAAVMRQAGFILGLKENMCGSAAYSPEQIRDPEFTATHGFTASVMDGGVMFNTLARPGDRRLGVPTVNNQIGTYDKFAIEWLYRVFPAGADDEALLKEMAACHEGDPEYLYLPLPSATALLRDSRARTGDLGNDPMADYNSRMSTLKFVADNSYDWLCDERLANSTDRELFLEWIWLSFKDATQLLASQLGAVEAQPMGSAVKYKALDKALQKKYIHTYFDAWRDMEWMQADRRLLHLTGLYRNVTDISNMNMAMQSGVRYRLPYIIFAGKDAASGYGPDEFLTDMEGEIFRNVRQGRLLPQEEMGLAMYMSQVLLGSSPVLKMNYEREANPRPQGVVSAENDIFAPLTGVPAAYMEEMDIIARRHLEQVRGMLRQGRARASDVNVKGKIDYLLRIADTALDMEH